MGASSFAIGLLYVVVTIACMVFIDAFVSFFLWWFVCTLLISRSRREATFAPTQDLTYYRDTLKGLTAVQVILLADLRVEPREDAAATLLALERRGVVSTEGERVCVADEARLESLSPSDRLLVELAAAGNLGTATYEQWVELAEQEMAIVAVFMVAFIFPLIGWQRRPRQHCGVVGLCHLRQRGRLAAVS